MIKTWQQRCEDHEGIVTNQMILDRMQEEFDELRQALALPVDLAKVGEVGVWGQASQVAPPKKEWVGLTEEEFFDLLRFDGRLDHVEVPLIADFIRTIQAKLKEKNSGA
jgi:hypothetical protein